MRKKLGKIKSVKIGFCGYQDAELGFHFVLEGSEGWGVVTSPYSAWGMEPDEHCKWTREDQTKQLGEAFLKIRDLLKQAKVEDVRNLIGKPVEVTFDGTILKNWRLLTEVL